MSDYHNNFSMRDNILFFCITTIISYIFFVECKFKARISAYSLYTIVGGVLLYNVGVMSSKQKLMLIAYIIVSGVLSYTYNVGRSDE